MQYSLVFIKVFASEARLFAFLFPLKNHASILVWHGFLFPGFIADLRGKTLRERAKELIKIAHPDFREELTQKALEKYKTL